MIFPSTYTGFPGGSDGKNVPIMQETQVRSLGLEDPLEKKMSTYSSVADKYQGVYRA